MVVAFMRPEFSLALQNTIGFVSGVALQGMHDGCKRMIRRFGIRLLGLHLNSFSLQWQRFENHVCVIWHYRKTVKPKDSSISIMQAVGDQVCYPRFSQPHRTVRTRVQEILKLGKPAPLKSDLVNFKP